MKASYDNYTRLIQIARSTWRKEPRCVICGNKLESGSKTKEHVPPAGVFVGSIDEELFTVPCCQACNNGTSKSDREFKYSLALFCEKISKHQTTSGSKLYSSLRDKLDRRSEENFPNNLKANLNLYLKQPGLYRQHQWWPQSSHDPVILKIICGLFWLYRGGEIFTDRSYRLIICRDINFFEGNANSHIGQSYPGISIGNGQFIAHHIQSFEDTKSIYSGVFGLSLHFQTRMKMNRGYHALAYCIPLQTIEGDDYVSGFMKKIDSLNLRQDKVSQYNIEVGGVVAELSCHSD